MERWGFTVFNSIKWCISSVQIRLPVNWDSALCSVMT